VVIAIAFEVFYQSRNEMLLVQNRTLMGTNAVFNVMVDTSKFGGQPRRLMWECRRWSGASNLVSELSIAQIAIGKFDLSSQTCGAVGRWVQDAGNRLPRFPQPTALCQRG
jgi:hypothetical protein